MNGYEQNTMIYLCKGNFEIFHFLSLPLIKGQVLSQQTVTSGGKVWISVEASVSGDVFRKFR